MAITHGTTARNNMADGVDDAVNAGTAAGALVLIDGTKDVASFTLQDPAFGAAAAGAIALAGTTLTATAATAGTNVTKFEIRSSGGTAQVIGTVATAGADLTIDNPNITTGQTVKLTSFTWNAPS